MDNLESIVGIMILTALSGIAINAISAYSRRERDIQRGIKRSLSEYLIEFRENLRYFMNN